MQGYHRLPYVEPDVVEDHHHAGGRLGVGQVTGGALNVVRGDRGRDRQDHEGDLLAPDRPRARTHPVPQGRTEAAERIDVEDHQDDGQAHHDRLRRQRQPRERDGREVPAAVHSRWVLARFEVGEDREQEEEARGEVPTLGDPGHRLHPEWMHREEERGRRRAESSCQRGGRGHREREQATGHQIEQAAGRRVQQEIREVIAEGPHAPHRVVGPEGEPRHRDPVAHHAGGQHPAELSQAEAPVVGIGEEIDRIVPIGPVGSERGQEDRGGHEGDLEGDGPPGDPLDERGDGALGDGLPRGR